MSVGAKSDPKSELQSLNNYLVDKVDSQAIEANMKAVKELFTNKCGSCFPFKRDSTSSLRKFVALDTIKDLENQCDRTSYSILLDICRTNDFKVQKRLGNGQTLSRIDSILLEYSTRHAERCKSVYPVAFENKLNQLDKTQLHRVETHANIVMRNARFLLASGKPYRVDEYLREHELDYMGYHSQFKYCRGSYEALSLLANKEQDPRARSLTKVVLDERKGVPRVDEPMIEALAKTYLFEPCQYYVNELGLDVFEPFEFDLKVRGSDVGNESDANLEQGSQLHNFYAGLVRYKFCKRLLSEKESVKRSLVKCIKYEEGY